MEEELKNIIQQAHDAGAVTACWIRGIDISNEQYYKSEERLKLAIKQFIEKYKGIK